MQGSVTEVIAESRELNGSSASKKLRRSGKVPGIVYGSDGKPTLIQLDHNQISLALDVESFHSSILELKIGNSNEKVLLRDYQMHPFKRQVNHIDFQRVDEKKRIHKLYSILREELYFSTVVKEEDEVMEKRKDIKDLKFIPSFNVMEEVKTKYNKRYLIQIV